MVVLRTFTAAALMSVLPSFAVATTCTLKTLDFEGLDRGVYVTDQFKAQFGVDIACMDGGANHGCRIFDSEVPYGDWTNPGGETNQCTESCGYPNNCAGLKNACGDPDLGSPNKKCSGGGHGVGAAGEPNKPYENCTPQGKILIIDENGELFPPDDKVGGFMAFSFADPVNLKSISTLDNELSETISVSVSIDKRNCTVGLVLSRSSSMLTQPSFITDLPFGYGYYID